MKPKIFLIIFISQINLYISQTNVDIYFRMQPLPQYGEYTFKADGSFGSIFALDISNFNVSESIYYYFEFNPDDALDANSQPFLTFYAVYCDGYDVDFFTGFIENRNSYIKNPKKTSDLTSKTTFYFETIKPESYKYLVIFVITDDEIIYDYKFVNSEKDESRISKTTVIVILVVLGVIIVIAIVVGIVWYLKKKKKKKGTTTIIYQNANDQQSQYPGQQQVQYGGQQQVQYAGQQVQYGVQPVQYGGNVQTYSQGQMAQPVQNVQGYQPVQYAQPQNVNNVDIGYSSQGVAA